jgi:hypothetical protein
MANFEPQFATFDPPEVAPANTLEWSNCGLKRIPKDSEQLHLKCQSLNVSLYLLLLKDEIDEILIKYTRTRKIHYLYSTHFVYVIFF